MTAQTAELATFIAEQSLDEVPAAARTEVVRAVLDFVGVAWRGRLEPVGEIVEAVANQHFGEGRAAVIGSSVTLSPHGAALVNGTCGHALDYDDIGLNVGHPTAAILPAALAAAEIADADGAALVGAMAIGYEVAARFASLTSDNLSGPYALGYHGTSLYGVFGAAAAAARLLHADAREAGMALAIAASHSSGLRVNFGTMTKPLHAGQSCADGLLAATLAVGGLTASTAGVEGRYGWLDVIGGRGPGVATMTSGLGEQWALNDQLWFKPYPCCGANHYAIDGVIRLMSEHGLRGDDIERLRVSIDRRYIDEVLVYDWPTTGLEGKFSLRYNVAAAASDGAVGLRTYLDERIDHYLPWRDRIEIDPRADIDRHSVIIRVETTGGQVFDRVQDTLRGTPADPMSWAELGVKFTDNLADLPIATIEAAVAAIGALDDASVRVGDVLAHVVRR